MRYPLISLFTGAGGLDLGLEFAGFTTIAANELEPQACETLRQNKMLSTLRGHELKSFLANVYQQRCFNSLEKDQLDVFFNRLEHDRFPCLQNTEILEGDIRDIPSFRFKSTIPKGIELFAIAGGPPCQPFSKAGKRKTFDCTKNGDLFFEFVRLVNDLKPKWFIFENVKGLAFTKTDVLYSVCRVCGSKKLADFRVRQSWEDNIFQSPICPCCNSKETMWIIINEPSGSLNIIKNEFEKLGYRCFSKLLNAADFGAPQIRERFFIVGNKENLNFEWPMPTHFNDNKNELVQSSLFEETSLRPWKTMKEVLWNSGHWHYGKIDEKQAVLWVKNIVRPHDEPVTWPLDRPAPTIGAHQGAKLAFAPQGVPKEQLIRQQWHTRGKRQSDTLPVQVEHVYLSDEELLRLQTFPRWWYLHGTRMQRAFQIGNAVPPLLAQCVGKAILKAEEHK
jgi:DNA (cytosine-5)-methyltransferase 1